MTMTDTIETVQQHGQGMLSIPDHSGDTRIMWDPRNTDEVEIAEASFKKAQKKGMIAYAVGADGESTGVVIRDFDPNASKIIMVKQLVGG